MAASAPSTPAAAQRAAPRNLKQGVKLDPKHYELDPAEKCAIKQALPPHALAAATECRKLGVVNRLKVKMKDEATGEPFEANVTADMHNLIEHYRSYGELEMLSIAQSYQFKRYVNWRRLKEPRWGETPAEKREREELYNASRGDIEKWKKFSRVTKPDTVSAKGNKAKWALKLEYKEVRDHATSDVSREAPLTMLRLFIRDIEMAAEVMRRDPMNKGADWAVGFGPPQEGGMPREILPDNAPFKHIVSDRAQTWLNKAERHYMLYEQMLTEWVEENARELKIHAVFYNLYYNPLQRSVQVYQHLKKTRPLYVLPAQFNLCHTEYLKHMAKKGWAKLRYWVFCHFSNRMTKIAWYWRELGAQRASRPADAATGWEGGRDWLEFMASLSEFEFVAPPIADEPPPLPTQDELFSPPARAQQVEEDARKAVELSKAREAADEAHNTYMRMLNEQLAGMKRTVDQMNS